MVIAAERAEVALAAASALVVRHRVVVVALGRGHPAARCGTARVADLDEVPKPWRWSIVAAFPLVSTVGARKGADPQGEGTHHRVARWPTWGCAAVPDGLAVLAGHGDAPADGRSIERAGGEIPGGERCDGPEAAKFARALAQADQRRQWDGQIHRTDEVAAARVLLLPRSGCRPGPGFQPYLGFRPAPSAPGPAPASGRTSAVPPRSAASVPSPSVSAAPCSVRAGPARSVRAGPARSVRAGPARSVRAGPARSLRARRRAAPTRSLRAGPTGSVRGSGGLAEPAAIVNVSLTLRRVAFRAGGYGGEITSRLTREQPEVHQHPQLIQGP